MATKEGLHRLVDALPEHELDEAERILTALQTDDPVLRALALAPTDDEELTPEEEEALREGLEALARGDVRSLEDVERELGL
jgi:hypothetical protein